MIIWDEKVKKRGRLRDSIKLSPDYESGVVPLHHEICVAKELLDYFNARYYG